MSTPSPESSIGFSDTWRVRRAAPGTRSSRARHRRPEAIPCHEFQRRPLEHSANLDPKLRTLPVCPSGALNVARIRWGKRIFQKRGSLNLAFRPAKPGLIAQQGKQVQGTSLLKYSLSPANSCDIGRPTGTQMERPKLGIEICPMLQRPSLEFMARNCLRPAVARAARTGPGRGTPDSPGV